MHIARVKLNPRRRQAVALMTDPQKMHAAVEAGFPDPDPNRRNLWRGDDKDTSAHLLVVSSDEPALTHIVEQAGWTTAPAETKSYDRHLADLTNGQKVRFHLKANPSRRSPQDGKIYGHVTVEQQTQWFLDRCEKWGLLVAEDAVIVAGRDQQEGHKKDSKGRSRNVTHLAAVFVGEGTVVDADALRAAMVGGCGRGKAYGLGLLTVVAA